MSTNVVVPTLGESITEAVLLRWLKTDGEYVNAEEPLAELETDKTNVDIPADKSGVLRHAKKPGDAVMVGETIARIDDAAAPAAPKSVATIAKAPATAPASPGGAQAQATKGPATNLEDLRPSVRRLVEENHLDPSAIHATGPGGRLIKEDVLRKLEGREAPAAAAPATPGNGQPAAGGSAATTVAAPPAPPSTAPAQASASQGRAGAAQAPAAPAATGGLAALGPFDASGVKRVPMSKIRRRIAERLLHAQQTAAILTTFNEIDMSAVMALRAKYKDKFNEAYGVPLGLMSFFARGVVTALREFPRVNAFVDGDQIVYHNYVNLGIAVSTDRGLTVPVLQHAEALSFAGIESEIKRLAAAAREGKLSLGELSGATFTITNGGVFGSLLSTPILSPPESGILGMHAIVKRPIAVGDKVEIRPMMYVALSYDHRLVDGRESVSFLVRLKESLEDPTRLMLEI